MTVLRLLCTSLVIIVLGTPAAIRAHSFDIAVVAPFSGSSTSEGNSLWQGMRVATREADGHPMETADGHLGGVDSNLLRIDSTKGVAGIMRQLNGSGPDQDLLIVVLAPQLSHFIDRLPLERPKIILLTGTSPTTDTDAVYTPAELSAPTQTSFANAYYDQYGKKPSNTALRGYTVARLIDAAIRPLDGDLSNPARVRQSFDRSMQTGDGD